MSKNQRTDQQSIKWATDAVNLFIENKAGVTLRRTHISSINLPVWIRENCSVFTNHLPTWSEQNPAKRIESTPHEMSRLARNQDERWWWENNDNDRNVSKGRQSIEEEHLGSS